MTQKEKAKKILNILKKTYTKNPEDFILWKNPLELLIGTVLSAQSTDKQINKITKTLFKKYKTPQDYAKASLSELEKEIHSCGFYKNKAKYLKNIGIILSTKYNNKVPHNLKSLLSLPGVSYKSAYLILSKAFNKHIGVAVDTHVLRIAPRLGLVKSKDRNQISKELSNLYKPRDYLDVNEYFILHGRKICKSKPLCKHCVLKNLCPSYSKFVS